MTHVTDADLGSLSRWAKAKLSVDIIDRDLSYGELKVLRQDMARCWINSSLTNKPLTIGATSFARGIATHALSEIAVKLPSSGREFQAQIGRDENGITKGQNGNIIFVVEAAGKELYRSEAIHGGEQPIGISVPLDGAKEFVLKVAGVADWGHADWAEAVVELESGEQLWLDDLPLSGISPEASDDLPFSFIYDGKSSRDLIPSWTCAEHTDKLGGGRTCITRTYTDPKTRLVVTWETTLYSDFAVAQWVLHFRNDGSVDTPIIENIQAIDTSFHRSSGESEFVIHSAIGSICASEDFTPNSKKIDAKACARFVCEGGRSSSGTLPYFNIEAAGGGAILSVGWTGQWAATFQRDESTGIAVQAGMEVTHLKLHPGEQIRTPGISLLFWTGDLQRGHNLWRSFILEHHTPKPGGKQLNCPICFTSWGMVPEARHMERISKLAENDIKFDYYWIDAGWYGDCRVTSDWVSQVGNWQINKSLYPNGFKPISDALHALGKGFVLWFDSERVYEGSQIQKEHPEWVLTMPGSSDCLFNMGIPEARVFMTDLISGMIAEHGVDIYRQDFNIDPLIYWQAIDAPDRQGMSEIKHIEGLYAFLDELLRRHPNLIIDNCSSGGRRLDLEMTQRSVPLWRSDLQCCEDYSPEGSQSQTFGLAYWLPMSTCGCREIGDTYDLRSAIGPGTQICWPEVIDSDFPIDWAREMMEEVFAVSKYYYGDFYPLTSFSTADDVWLAYQLDRPDLGEGAIIAYRRKNCPYPSAILKPKTLDAEVYYQLDFVGTGDGLISKGADMMSLGVDIKMDQPESSVIILYRRYTER